MGRCVTSARACAHQHLRAAGVGMGVHACVCCRCIEGGVAVRHEKQEKKTDILHLRAAGIGMGVHALCCVEGGGGAGVTVKA